MAKPWSDKPKELVGSEEGDSAPSWQSRERPHRGDSLGALIKLDLDGWTGLNKETRKNFPIDVTTTMCWGGWQGRVGHREQGVIYTDWATRNVMENNERPDCRGRLGSSWGGPRLPSEGV
jgi:hypothetical protein